MREDCRLRSCFSGPTDQRPANQRTNDQGTTQEQRGTEEDASEDSDDMSGSEDGLVMVSAPAPMLKPATPVCAQRATLPSPNLSSTLWIVALIVSLFSVPAVPRSSSLKGSSSRKAAPALLARSAHEATSGDEFYTLLFLIMPFTIVFELFYHKHAQ